jgi:HlyD family secretion protein
MTKTSKPISNRVAWLAIATVVALIAVGLWLAYRPAPDQLQGMVDTDEITIATKVPLSRVEKLLVSPGQSVRAGQELAVLSSPEIDARSAQAAGVLTSAEALQSRTMKGLRKEDLVSLKAAWQAAQAGAVLAQKTFTRTDNLHREGVVSLQRRDEALAARDATAKQAELAHAQYQKALSGATQEERAAADAQVQIAKAGVAETDSLRGETRLTAPRSGEIAKRMVNGGEIVPLAFPIFTLVDLNDLWVTVNVREDQFHSLKKDQVVSGAVPALQKKAVRFRVDYISPQGDFATWRATRQSKGYDVRSFEVRLRPVDRLDGLRPGMSVLFDWPQ